VRRARPWPYTVPAVTDLAEPGASILEFGANGISEVAWADLLIVENGKRYLSDPRAYLRQVLE